MERIKLRNHEIITIREFLVKFFGYDFLDKSRKSHLVFKRKIAIANLYDLGFSKLDISKIIQKNHATIIQSLTEFKDPEYDKLKQNYKEINSDLISLLIQNNIPFKQK